MRATLAVGLVLLAGFAGADDKKPDPKSTVEGVVTLDGKTLNGCQVTFEVLNRANKGTGSVAFGVSTDANGRFKLDLPPGGYALSCSKVRDEPKGMGRVELLPQKYTSPETSGLKLTVKAGEQTFDIKLASR